METCPVAHQWMDALYCKRMTDHSHVTNLMTRLFLIIMIQICVDLNKSVIHTDIQWSSVLLLEISLQQAPLLQ